MSRRELLGFSRTQSRSYTRQTVRPTELDAAVSAGWVVQRRNKKSISLIRDKPKPQLLESRIWTVLYRMGFTHMSSAGGADLVFDGSDPKSARQQIDVLAVDQEAAVAVECKTAGEPKKDPRFAEKVAKHAAIRAKLAAAVKATLPVTNRRHVTTVMATWDLILRDADTKRAAEEKVVLFDEHDLEYYEALVKHLGAAARYQLLAELFKGRKIAGLEVRVPALRARMGPLTCYTFSVRPDYLLKIAYIAHRAKGKPFDVDSYQRMLSKSRLKRIAEFITNDGIFPTNIVINIEDSRHLRFDRGRQEAQDSDTGGVFGWLTLSPTFGSAWVIDGQHRLFAYSGHPRADSSYLNVLAFQGLSAPKQTELFVEINSEQRRVKRSLLVELDATLKWESEDEDKRVHAVISKAGMALDSVPESPLRNRVQLAAVRRTQRRCVSLTAIATALSKPGFYIVTRKTNFTQYGPLWRDDPDACLRRTVLILVEWLGGIAGEARDWWELGAEEGGGLAMNDGVTVCINMLRSVMEHLNSEASLSLASDEDVVTRLAPYAKAIGAYLARKTPEERLRFRRLRGVEGQTTGTRECQAALQGDFPKYQPEGLSEWLRRRDANTNEEGRRIIDEIEKSIQDRILEVLKSEFDLDENAWWFEGVPVAVRKKVDDRINEAGGGRREENFDFLHYEAIIKQNWSLLKSTFAFGEGNPGKDRGTSWLREIGGWRNKVMHPSRRDYLGLEELEKLQQYQTWLRERLAQAPVED